MPPLLMAWAYYNRNDYARAVKTASTLIHGEIKAGKIPAEDTIRLLVCCEYALKDMVACQLSLLRLVSYYPNSENWSVALCAVRAALGADDPLALYVDRLRRATGVALTPSSYMDMAQLALRLNRPGEAVAALDDGYDRHVLGQSGNIERQRRLYARAHRLSREELAQLPERGQRARRAVSGGMLVALGKAYVGHEDWKNAVDALRKGLQKDLLRNPERARLALGIAYLGVGHPDKAVTSFRQIPSDNARFSAIAQLWAIWAEQSHRTGTMSGEGVKETSEPSFLTE